MQKSQNFGTCALGHILLFVYDDNIFNNLFIYPLLLSVGTILAHLGIMVKAASKTGHLLLLSFLGLALLVLSSCNKNPHLLKDNAIAFTDESDTETSTTESTTTLSESSLDDFETLPPITIDFTEMPADATTSTDTTLISAPTPNLPPPNAPKKKYPAVGAHPPHTNTPTTTQTSFDSSSAISSGSSSSTTTTGTGLDLSPLIYDLSSALPATASSSDCEISDGILQIKKVDGVFADSCSVLFSIKPEQVSGKMISVDADRVNLFDHTDFTDITTTDVLLYKAATASNNSALATGSWYSNATWPSKKPTVSSGTAVITKQGGLVQFFKIKPAAKFLLSFNADVSLLGTAQLLTLELTTYDKDFNKLTYYNPVINATATTLNNFVNYGVDQGDFTEHLNLEMLDREDHQTYAAGDGSYTKDVYFNFFESAGQPLKTAAGTEVTDKDIAYASIQFGVNWSASANGSTNLQWVKLDDAEQIKYEVLNAESTVLASGYGANTFYVPTVENAASLRISLRTLKNSESPQIRSLTLGQATPLTVTAGAKKASFTKPRLGGLQHLGPKGDYENSALAMRSLCVDPLTNETISCLDIGPRYNSTIFNSGIPQSYLNVELNSANTDYEFSLNAIGEGWLKRVLEGAAKGFSFKAILVKSGGFMYNSPTDAKSWAVATEGTLLTDPTGTRDSEAQEYYLLEQYARFVADLFTGTKEYTFQYVDAGTSATLPKIGMWEIFNEDNITATSWATTLWVNANPWGKIADTTVAKEIAGKLANVMAAMSGAIKESISDAEVSYASFAAYDGPVFNTGNIATIGSVLDASAFDLNNFHPYANMDPINGKEDLIKKRWQVAQETLTAYGLDNYDTVFGEYGFTHEIYDPACIPDVITGIYQKTTTLNLKLVRGYGVGEYAKLTARETIALLSLEAEAIIPYGMMTFEAQSWGKSINADGSGGFECWRSFAPINFNLYDRVAGTGILSGKDEPTTYTLNAGGVAHAITAKYLSVSDPITTTWSSTLNDDEYLNADLFSVSDGTILALSWYRAYDYGTDFMDYMSGVKDNGFMDKKIFAITPSGISFSSATLISLEDGSEQSLLVQDGTIQAPVGAMPVLIKLSN